MKILFPVICLMLTGCLGTVPIKQKFPEVPSTIMTKCPQLEKIKEDAKLSDVSKTVVINYGTYYECAVKTDAWIEWYQIQKKIFEEANE